MMLDPYNVWHWPIYAVLAYALWPLLLLVICCLPLMWMLGEMGIIEW